MSTTKKRSGENLKGLASYLHKKYGKKDSRVAAAAQIISQMSEIDNGTCRKIELHQQENDSWWTAGLKSAVAKFNKALNPVTETRIIQFATLKENKDIIAVRVRFFKGLTEGYNLIARAQDIARKEMRNSK